jgi:hypothetical protein
LKADIPAGYADSIFRQSPASAKAEEQPVVAIALTVSKVSEAAIESLPIAARHTKYNLALEEHHPVINHPVINQKAGCALFGSTGNSRSRQ